MSANDDVANPIHEAERHESRMARDGGLTSPERCSHIGGTRGAHECNYCGGGPE